jgi:hypothetical protein
VCRDGARKSTANPRAATAHGVCLLQWTSSRMMRGDTYGSGMPTSKGLDVELEVIKNDRGWSTIVR